MNTVASVRAFLLLASFADVTLRLLQQLHDQHAANRQKRIGDSETNGEAERWHATTGRILNDRQRDG